MQTARVLALVAMLCLVGGALGSSRSLLASPQCGVPATLRGSSQSPPLASVRKSRQLTVSDLTISLGSLGMTADWRYAQDCKQVVAALRARGGECTQTDTTSSGCTDLAEAVSAPSGLPSTLLTVLECGACTLLGSCFTCLCSGR